MENLYRLRLSPAIQRLKAVLFRPDYPNIPEPRYACEWCRDTGLVECITETDDVNYPIKFANVAAVRREKEKTHYFTGAPCRFCDAGERWRFSGRGRNSKTVDQWVTENVGAVASLKGTYEKAAEDGYSEKMVDMAFKRQGIRKDKQRGMWICERTEPGGIIPEPVACLQTPDF